MPAAAPARSRSKRRGAARDVVAIDLSPTLVDLARERAPRDLGAGRVDFRVGDMLDPALGRFDHVVAMDSLIHYRAADSVRVAGGARAARTAALDPLHLRAAHAAAGRHARGRPPVPARRPRARDRAGRRGATCARALAASARPDRLAAGAHRTASTSGFYISQALELRAR